VSIYRVSCHIMSRIHPFVPYHNSETRTSHFIHLHFQLIQRLEVDVLLGTWAIENVHLLSLDELNQFEDFVNIETIDIYNIITLRTDVPESMRKEDGNGVVERIQEWARSSPLGKAEPDKFHTLKKQNNLN